MTNDSSAGLDLAQLTVADLSNLFDIEFDRLQII
jgi:hypothetical protein